MEFEMLLCAPKNSVGMYQMLISSGCSIRLYVYNMQYIC